MKRLMQKKNIVVSVVATFISMIVGILLVYPQYVGLCPQLRALGSSGKTYCITSTDSFGAVLALLSLSLLLSLIPLLFLRVEVYRTWRKFALWYWGVGIFLLLIIPGGGGGGWAMSFPSPKDILTVLLPILFLIISYMLMLAKSQQLRKRK